MNSIIGDVLPQKREVFRTANQMIEWFALPKGAFAAKPLVDLPGSEMQPTLALAAACRRGSEFRDQMHVVRHDDQAIDVVPLPIKMEERFENDVGQLTLPENAFAVTRVKMPLPATIAELPIVSLQTRRDRVNIW